MSEDQNPPVQKHNRHPRYDYRARSHDTAHAAEQAAPLIIPEHPLIPRNSPSLITSPDALAELLAHLRSAGRFAYDSEFIGELTFFPKLCLIQVATAQRVALIDPLAGLDLAPFWQLVADPSVEKIVHAGQQDLEPVFRHLNCPPANIIDTQIAAAFAGLSYPAGLSRLVRELVGVQLGKGFTFTHWDRRPLSSVQLRYAADDVRYLPAVRQAIGKRLGELGHTAWAMEECVALTDPNLYHIDPEFAYLRLRGANSLSPRNAAILRELVIWRQDAARRYDSPPRSYVKDEILVDMARSTPRKTDDLNRVRNLPRPVEEAEGGNIIAAIQRGLSMPEAECPAAPPPEESPGERFTIDSLWAALQAWCLGHCIDPNLVASRQELTRYYRDTRSDQPRRDSRLLRGWRAQFVGEFLSDFLTGRRSVALAWTNGNESYRPLKAHAQP